MATGTAVVVGAGIGGLASAAALSAVGWKVTVLERAPALEPVGAGISLWPNALRALEVLGLRDAVRDLSALGAGSGVRTPDGRWLGRTDVADAVRDRFGDPLVVLSRAELTELLVSRVTDGTVRTGAAVVAVEPGRAGDPEALATASTADGAEYAADLVVAADGIGSGIRSRLFPDHPGPEYAGYTTWRLIAPAPAGVAGSETWGAGGQRFAIVPMAGGRVYCYATATTPAGVTSPDEAAELRTRFGGWHDPIPEILSGLAPGQVLHHDIYELVHPLPGFSAGRVALVGDAAHAMTPELGQGGCLAIEDAVTLARVVGAAADTGPGLASALERYTAARLPRTTRLAKRSRSTGRLTQASGPVGIRLRNLSGRVMARLPASAVVRGLDSVVDWRPEDGSPPPTSS